MSKASVGGAARGIYARVRRGRVAVVGAGLAVALTAGGIAWATIPNASGVFTGCYANSGGALRVIDPSKGQSCTASETQIAWNQKGLNWRGAWSATASYAVGDVATYLGSSYYARKANTNNAPPQNVNWATLAHKGHKGDPGPAGVSTGASATSGTPVTLNQGQTLVPVLTSSPVSTSGTYYVNASVMLIVAQGDTVTCILAVGGNASGPFATVGPVANLTYETLPLAAPLSLNAGDAPQVLCTDYTSNDGTSFYDGGITSVLINSPNPAAATSRGAKPLPAGLP